MPLPLGAILLVIDIIRKLVTIQPKSKGRILNLFIKTGKDYSLAVNSTEFLLLTQVYFFSLDQNWVLNIVITSYALLYITQLSNHNMVMSSYIYLRTLNVLIAIHGFPIYLRAPLAICTMCNVIFYGPLYLLHPCLEGVSLLDMYGHC